jgi:hypothetical protein
LAISASCSSSFWTFASTKLGGGMQTCFDHLGGFQVLAIDGDGFRYNLAILSSGSVNVHLESGYQHSSGHFLFAQAIGRGNRTGS